MLVCAVGSSLRVMVIVNPGMAAPPSGARAAAQASATAIGSLPQQPPAQT
jgi:hypothetical protein